MGGGEQEGQGLQGMMEELDSFGHPALNTFPTVWQGEGVWRELHLGNYREAG